MELKIKHLELCNFGMFRTYSVDFDDKLTVLAGSNGTGKSTIANAIQYLLVGKSADGRSKFALKTHDKEGNEIPKVDHFVKADVTFDGEPFKLCKGITEKWTKVKGENREVMSNETYYSINDEPCKKTEWDAFIGKYIKEPIFKAVTNPTYFVSLDWKTQRTFLYKVSGGISNEEICGSDQTFDPLLQQLEHETINNILQSYGYQIKELQDKLDKIPIRIAEQNKALPEKKDWDDIGLQLEGKKELLKGYNDRLAELKSGNVEDAHRKELDKKLSQVSKQLSDIRIAKESAHNELRNKANVQIATCSNSVNHTQNTINDLTAKKEGLDNLIKRAEQAKNQAVLEKQKIEAEFDKLKNNHLEFPENLSFCPTCGQLLPEDQIEQKRKEMQENFNKDKVDKANALKVRYKDAKKDIADAEDTANRYQGEVAKTTTSILTLKNDLENAQKELSKAKEEKAKIQSVEDMLSADENYQTFLKERDSLQEEFDKPVSTEENTELLNALAEKIETTDSEIAQLQDILAEEKLYNKVQKNIEDINTEQVGISSKITKLEKAMDIAREYSNRQGTILEDKVNKLFSICKWKMFKTYQNGSKEDFCEVYGLDGSAYHDTLNTSMKLNIGIDICNTLSRIYKCSCPIVADNAESNVTIQPSSSQMILLKVENHPLEVRNTL